MTTKNLKEEGRSKKSSNGSTRSLGGKQLQASTHNIPPPPPPPPQASYHPVRDDVALSHSVHARFDEILANQPERRAAGASNYQRAKSARILPTPPSPASAPSSLSHQRATSARILPASNPPPPPPPPAAGLSNYQRARSARILPSAPPPPPPPPPSAAKFGNQSLGAINFGSGGASSRGLSMQAPASSTRMAMGKASSVRLVAPPPPPPPPPSAPASLHLTSAASSSRLGALPPPPPPPPHKGLTPEPSPVASSVAAPKGEKESQLKKEKKKKEVPLETFEDELEDVSESEGDEGLTAEERAEKTEKEVRKTLCIAICTACGMLFLISLISKLCQKFSSTEYTGEDELLNAAGNAAPVPPPPAGVEQVVNVGIAQQMAVAAGQSAAASSAAGATSAATVATAAVVTVSSVTTTAVTGASAVTLTGVGMATGIVPVPRLFKPEHPCHVFLDEITPHKGHLNLHMKNLPANFFNIPDNVPALELAFTEAFNKVLGTCVAYSIDGHNNTDTNNTLVDEIPSDVYARFLQNTTLEGWNFWYVPDKKGEKIEYFTTEWSAFVGCDDTGGKSLGCSDLEPLFYDGDMMGRGRQQRGSDTDNQVGVNTTRRQLLLKNPSLWRWLEKSDLVNGKKQSNLELFMDSFALELREMMEESTDPEHARLVPDLFYGASLRSNDTNTIVEEEGTKYQYGFIIEAKGSGGAVDRPLGLPICKSDDGTPIATLELKEGYLHLGLQGIDEAFFNSAEQTIKELFREAYNDMDSTGCDGYYRRVLEIAEVQGILGWKEQGRWLLSTNWSAMVTCDGCSDIEPLFFFAEQSDQGRRLEISSDSEVANFANAFAAKVSDLYKRQSPSSVRKVEAFYAASVDGSGTVVGEEVGERRPFATRHQGLVDCATGEPPPVLDNLDKGNFALYVKDLIKDMNKDILAGVMQDIYNDLNGCESPMQRVAHQLSIDTMKHIIIDDSQIYVAMNMTTKLTCTGCNAVAEPMFGREPVQGSGRRLDSTSKALFERFKAKLTTQINLLLTDYESTPYYQEGVSLFQFTDAKAEHKPVDVVYGATYDRSGQVTHYGTPVHNNIFVKEELRAGTDVIVAVTTCKRDLKFADKNHDHGLNKPEYFHFVEALYPSVFPGMAPPAGELKNYGILPNGVKDVFEKFTGKGGSGSAGQSGGEFFFGDLQNDGFVSELQRQRVEAICYHTSHAIKDHMQPLTTSSPVTSAPTTATPTTAAPTTTAPTTTAPTQPPSEMPTVSAAPTETRLVEIDVEWTFRFDVESTRKRDATPDEYQQFTSVASNWLTKIYGNWDEYNFESLTTSFVDGKYDGDLDITAITKSDFIFRGAQPQPRLVFEYLNNTNIEPFLTKEIWQPDGTDNPWIFDDMLGLTVAKSRER